MRRRGPVMDAISHKGHARSHGVAASRGGARPGMTVDVFGMNAYILECLHLRT